MAHNRIEQTRNVLRKLGMDDERSNERSAMVFLALAGLDEKTPWKNATNNMLGTRAIMDWIRDKFGVEYKPNTRETIRRFTLHQFVQAGIVEENADAPKRPINSPKWNYRLSELVLMAIRQVDTPKLFDYAVVKFTDTVGAWKNQYYKERNILKVPITLPNGKTIELTAGGQNDLISQIINEFCPRFTPKASILYIDDTGKDAGEMDHKKLVSLGIKISDRGKAPDLIVWLESKKWLFLIEACSSHGPIDVTRKNELDVLFSNCKAEKIFVSCFPNRKIMQKYLSDLAWETEAWCADTPDHIIHFNGTRFLQPYDTK